MLDGLYMYMYNVCLLLAWSSRSAPRLVSGFHADISCYIISCKAFNYCVKLFFRFSFSCFDEELKVKAYKLLSHIVYIELLVTRCNS